MKKSRTISDILLDVFNITIKSIFIAIILLTVLSAYKNTIYFYEVLKKDEISSIIQNKVFDDEYSCLSYIDGEIGRGRDSFQIYKFEINKEDSSWIGLSNKFDTSYIWNDECRDNKFTNPVSVLSSIDCLGEYEIKKSKFVYKFKVIINGVEYEDEDNIELFLTKNNNGNTFLYIYIDGWFIDYDTLDKYDVLKPYTRK